MNAFLPSDAPVAEPQCGGLFGGQEPVIPAALPFGPLSGFMNALPLSGLGFGWLLPALIGIGVGLVL